MFIRLSKLTGKAKDKGYCINPDQIIMYGPKITFEQNMYDENQTTIYFTDDRTANAEKSPKDVADILRDCGVEVWR